MATKGHSHNQGCNIQTPDQALKPILEPNLSIIWAYTSKFRAQMLFISSETTYAGYWFFWCISVKWEGGTMIKVAQGSGTTRNKSEKSVSYATQPEMVDVVKQEWPIWMQRRLWKIWVQRWNSSEHLCTRMQTPWWYEKWSGLFCVVETYCEGGRRRLWWSWIWDGGNRLCSKWCHPTPSDRSNKDRRNTSR